MMSKDKFNSTPLIFFGTTIPSKKVSWGTTNLSFYTGLSQRFDDAINLDYSIYSWGLSKFDSVLFKLITGNDLLYSPLRNFIKEIKLNYLVSRYKIVNGVSVHSGDLCITKRLKSATKNYLYVDATIINEIMYGDPTPPKEFFNLQKKYFEKYFNRLDGILTFNEWTKCSLINDFGFDGEKVANIGFGISISPYTGQKNYREKTILIVLRRGLERIKGLNLLLDAFKIAKERISDLKLSVVGTTLQPQDGVTYYEGFPRETTIRLFQEASLFAMPALNESNGMVYLEALACRTPILGLDRLAFPEFCGYGKYGFIAKNPDPVEIAEKIIDAFSDPDRLTNMGNEGQGFATELYNWESVVTRALKFIEKTN